MRLEGARHRSQLGDPVALGEGGEHGLIEAPAQQLDLVPGHQPAEALEELRALGGHPFQQRAGVVEREAHAGMAFDRLDHRAVRPVADLGEHPAEVADRLMVVDRQGQRDPGGHGASSVLGGDENGHPDRRYDLLAAASGFTSTPAAGRYRRSTYSWSMRVAENRQIVLAIEFRMSCVQRVGMPCASRS